MRVAVVGGGVFGCTAAAELAQAGCTVELFEARSDILGGATARCQARLHRGYHYPRSETTALAAHASYDRFAERFPTAVRAAPSHYYLVAPDSRTNAADYLAFLDWLCLPHQPAEHPMVYGVDLAIRAFEAMIDVDMLRRVLRRELALAGVAIHAGARVEPDDISSDFDRVVWATYGQPWVEPLRYEICELAIVELGRYGADSFVVLDGDFISLDPWHGVHALYDVKHSVHLANVGTKPEIPDEYAELIARPGLQRSPLTHVDDMLDSAGRFLRGVDPRGRGVAIYHGSMYSVRAVLPDVDATDARPTLIRTDGEHIRVLAGKICTAPAAASAVVAEVTGLVPA